MFAEEKPALLPLPLEPFRYYQYGERTVHLDGCVEVEAAYYSAPPGWIGRRVQVQWDRPACSPARSADRPTAARASAPAARPPSHPRRGPSASALRSARCNCWRVPPNAGRRSAQFCQSHVSHSKGEAAVRRIQGILSFAKKYGVARVDDACAAALEVRGLRLPLRAPLSGAQVATAREPAPGRSAHPPTHSVPRPHRRTNSARPIRRPINEHHRTTTRTYGNSGSAAWPPCWKHVCARPRPNPWRPSI